MPKILINERDRTSPGTADSYANFSVLIVGFAGRTPDEKDEIQPDSNGVYEFSTAQAFADTIGLVAPRFAKETGNGQKVVYHYGNQMAYELLNMGYSIVFKPISEIKELADANFWEIFKDKASYDFRFITHGLLESSIIDENESYTALLQSKDNIELAINELDKIDSNVKIAQEANPELEEAAAKNEAYSLIRNSFDGFRSLADGKVYTNYDAARTGTAADLAAVELSITELTDGIITTSFINQVNGNIANLAKYTAAGANNTNDIYSKEISGRGDCVALIELDENTYVTSTLRPEDSIINAINTMTQINADNGKYCAMTVPSVYYKMAIDEEKPNDFGNNTKFPGAFHYLACFSNSLKLGFAEWYAAAGYTRGVASYVIERTSVKLGEIAINALEPRNYSDPQSDYPKFACNVIANFRGSYYLWGNRTAHPLGKKGNASTGDLVASSFLNIRHLCTTVKKQLYVACRAITFDPNSDALWFDFVNAIRPTLELMKADQGLRDYKILKVYTDKKATIKAKIRIVPIEAVEDFDLEVSLEDSFGETAAVVAE